MKNKDFLLLATSLKRDTGSELEQVGLSSSNANGELLVHGSLEDDYEMVYELSLKRKGKWEKETLNDLQKAVLKGILSREIELVREELREEMKIEQQAKKDSDDENKYGRAGAIYSKFY
jgi:hypothetical protein